MKQFLYVSLFLLLLLGCNETAVPTPTVPTEPTATINTPATATNIPTLSATAPPTAIHTPAPATEAVSHFSNLIFADKPLIDETSGAEVLGENPNFPPFVPEVYAHWDYINMSTEDVITRRWYHNDELWLEREENWSYDEAGTVFDVNVYDYEQGLRGGEYRLELLLNGALQLTGQFSIQTPDPVGPITAEGRTAVAHEDQLQITGDNINQTWTTNGPVTSMDWLPNGTALIFAVRRIAYPDIPLLFQGGHELWLLDLESGQQKQLAQLEENVHRPHVSPNGRFITLFAGSGYGDACFTSAGLSIMELNEQNEVVSLTDVTTYNGLIPSEYGIHFNQYTDYEEPRFNESKYPGVWEADNTLRISIVYTCVENSPSGPSGVYELDVAGQTAVFIEPLPES